jgi:3-keto-disaccharide hydrolase
MKLTSYWSVFAAAILLSLTLAGASAAQAEDWIPLFDGKSLKDWEQVDLQPGGKWSVEDGALVGSGPPSMLVCTKGPYKNFRYRAECRINDKGNSGLYFRTIRKPGFSEGFEAQIDSTHADPIRTGSLYGLLHVYKQLSKPDEWFTYDLTVRDDVWRGKPITRIKVTVNNDELYEYLDFEQKWKDGYFAFQQHDPGSKVSIRKVEVMPLPDK